MPTDLSDQFVPRIPPWWPPLVPLFRCTPRLLVVTDSLAFDNNTFGLGRFLAEVAAHVPAPIVTTRVHDGGFVFDGSVTTSSYDQIWLFGASGPALSDGEVQVLAEFMEAGGGVFATGDHETLGQALCGELPRVRKMRDWNSVPMSIERIDTVTNPGPDRRTQFDDQSDEFPQRVFPRFYGSGSTWSVHPLLRSPLGPIDVLPDHPHESVCRTGWDLEENYSAHGIDLDEFPDLDGRPLAPEIVAWSVSAGRYLETPGSVSGKPPTTPRLFGAISAWDGHRVGRGRIACDSTWHHFVNVNLDGTGAVAAPGNNRRGLRDASGTFTADYHQVATYYRNLVDWLMPARRQWCLWWIDLIKERYRFPLFEEFRPLPHPCPWDPRVALGTSVEGALEASLGTGRAEDVVTAALEAAALAEVAALVRPVATDERAAERAPLAVDPVELRRGILGTVADALLRDLPDRPERLPEHVREDHDDALPKVAGTAAREAIDALREHASAVCERTARVLGL